MKRELEEHMRGLLNKQGSLQTRVALNALSLSDYSERLEVVMKRDLALAKYLKSMGRKVEAVRVWQRVKIMRTEMYGNDI